MQPLTPEPQGAGLGAPPFSGVDRALWRNRGDNSQIMGGREPPGPHSVTRVTTHLTCGLWPLKSLQDGADTPGMESSPQQPSEPGSGRECSLSQELEMSYGVSPEVFQAALLAAENAPDLREDRIDRALTHLGEGLLDAHAVAQAMISRVLAETTR